jgi:Leucine-rich repeat (LRR) protein
MKINKIFFILLLASISFQLIAQGDVKEDAAGSVEEQYKDDLKFMIQSFETILNLLGDSTISRQDKDQIINQSYLKFFENDKVQIEDDLDPHRELPINKNVQSYLQDVVFFYKNIHFTFDIGEVSKGLNDKDQVYYKVSMEERLQGENLYGEPLNEINVRYVELNLNEKAQDFKIVSVYTTKLSEKEDLATWWNQLDSAWRNYFSAALFINDSTNIQAILSENKTIEINDTIITSDGDTSFFNTSKLFSSIKTILASEKITIQASDSIKSLDPISKFTKLRSIDFSGCLIDDVSPLRSLLSLRKINASNTLVNSLNDLQFLSSLQTLSIDNTSIYDLSVSSAWTNLEALSFENAPITDLSFLTELSSLKELNLSGNKTSEFKAISQLDALVSLNLSATSFKDIRIINPLQKLHSVYLDESSIASLKGVSDSLKLEIISLDNTKIADLSPMIGINSLKMIYCDNSMVELENVKSFITQQPGVLIIYETQSLQTWWLNLDENLKIFIRSRVDSISEPPQTETLHQIIFTESANLSGQTSINSLEGFQQLINLKSLDISGTMVSDLSPLSNVSQLTNLTISDTPVEDLSPLARNAKLQNLIMEKTKVTSLDSIVGLQNLELIKADESGLTQETALAFMQKNSALLLYQSSHLIQWWETLPDEWVHFFSKKMDFNKNPSAKELQELVNIDSLSISELSLTDYKPLIEFKLLTTLKLDRMGTKDLSPLASLTELSSLSINNGVIVDLITIGKLNQLKSIDFSTTSIDQLDFIIALKNVESLNISGTAVESLKPLVEYNKLVYLDLSNTRIKKINYLNNISSLKELKLTNADVSDKRITSFQRIRPEVKVIIY